MTGTRGNFASGFVVKNWMVGITSILSTGSTVTCNVYTNTLFITSFKDYSPDLCVNSLFSLRLNKYRIIVLFCSALIYEKLDLGANFWSLSIANWYVWPFMDLTKRRPNDCEDNYIITIIWKIQLCSYVNYTCLIHLCTFDLCSFKKEIFS